MGRLSLCLYLTLVLAQTACDKISTSANLDPIDFSGLSSVQSSGDKTYLLQWKAPRLVEVDSFEIYLMSLDKVPVASSSESEPAASAGSPSTDDSAPYPSQAEQWPDSSGRLLSLASPNDTSFKTPSLEEGLYAFQVKVLTKDGRRDSNKKARWLTVTALDSFKGVQLAEIQGHQVLLKWLPYPYLIEGEDYRYTVYKGEGFSEQVAVTKNTEIAIDLSQEVQGSTLTFGVRYRNGAGKEDQNRVTLPVLVPASDQNYLGCTTAKGLGSDRIEVNFEWPSSKYEAVRILRGQREVFYTLDRTRTQFVDRGLQEGETYSYTCLGVTSKETLVGSNVIRSTTFSTNAPNFAGITGVYLDASGKARVSWGVTTGVPAQTIRIYGNVGHTVDWSKAPWKVIEANVLNTTLESIGDDLTYAFGVRACGIGACDANTQQSLLTIGDRGPPLTPGAQRVTVVNGVAQIEVPWLPAQGGIAKRRLYVKQGGEPSPDISRYTPSQTVQVTDPFNPPLVISYNTLQSGQIYHFIVRDEDPAGRVSQNTQVVTLDPGDLTPPDFNGIASLTAGPAGQEDRSLTLGFQALAPQSVDPNGARRYYVYSKPGGGSACNEPAPFAILDAFNYPAGPASYTLTGLVSAMQYSVCLKAVDQAGNISTNSNSLARKTLDLTAPSFDGIQSLTYTKATGQMRLSWNPSPSSDILEYRIDVWHTPPNQSSVYTQSVTVKHSDNPSSFQFDQNIITFGSESKLEIVVNACDNAAQIPGGHQNCSSFGRSQAFSITLEDINPPPGFLGIAAENEQTLPAQGSIGVRWVAPSDWTDFAGFRVYRVLDDQSLVLMRDCACLQNPGCTDHLTTCTVTGLDAFRTYLLHVRAYDAQGNITQLDPVTSSTRRRTSDTTAPVFASNLNASLIEGTISLTWSAAIDNQYASEPEAKLQYKVFRKTGSNFANLLNPEADGLLLSSQSDLGFMDTQNLESGRTYYYTVCAFDSSNNQTCDGTFKSVTTPDLLPPQITSLSVARVADAKTWTLNWVMSDNTTPTADLVVRIRELASADSNAAIDETARAIFTQAGALTLPSLSGPKNVDTYVHYLLSVTDQAGNTASKKVSVYSQNRIVLESIKSSEGPTTGGKLLIIKGSGFHSSSQIDIAGNACLNTRVLSTQYLLCRSPAKSAGVYRVTISNEEGSSAQLDNAYSACTPNVNCTQICNNPASWQTQFALETNRGGNDSTPYIICSAAQLSNVRLLPRGRYFKLADNIDLSSYTNNSFAPLISSGTDGFQGYFQGDGYVVSNFSYSNGGTDYIGLFRRIQGNSQIRNLGVIDFNISGRDYLGALSGNADYDGNTIIDQILATGSISGRFYTGMALGYAGTLTSNINGFGTISGTRYVGGLFGLKYLNGSNLNFSGTLTATTDNSECYLGGIAGYWSGAGGQALEVRAKGTLTCGRTATNTNVLYRTGGLCGRLDNQQMKNGSFDGTITADREIGGAVGLLYNNALIENISTSGSISGGHRTGGLVGAAYGGRPVILNSSTSMAVTSFSSWVGGAVGYMGGSDITTNQGQITGVKALGSVTANLDSVGGLIGRSEEVEIRDSSAEGLVQGVHYVGGLVGYLRRGMVQNSFATGAVKAPVSDHTGGLVGLIESTDSGSTITSSFAIGTVQGRNNTGGLIGSCRGTIRNSYAKGDVIASGFAGGFCGRNYEVVNATNMIIENSYATGAVSSDTGDHLGGFIGYLYRKAQISRTYASGNVSGQNSIGGFIGTVEYGPTTIEQSFATGNAKGNYRVGGFLGYAVRFDATNAINFTNNYARGSVIANGQGGGFSGFGAAFISNSYATGRIQMALTEKDFGGFNGLMQSGGTGSLPNCFWDTNTSARTQSAGGTGKTSSQMKELDTFINFDSSIWTLEAGKYPSLSWQVTR